MSYEGVVVRICDTIAYIGRDIEDAILLKIIKRSDIPSSCRNVLGDTNRKIIHNLIMDLLNYSIDNDMIGYSEKIYEALRELKQFNYEKIYNRRDLHVFNHSTLSYTDYLREKFEFIFQRSLEDLERNDTQSPIFTDHIDYIDDTDYTTYYEPIKKQKGLALIVRDYIAGMSDNYFNEIYNRYKKK